MAALPSASLLALSADQVVRLRLAAMLAVLAGGVLAGFIAANRLGLPRTWAKKILTFLLVTIEWMIVLLVIWRLPLSKHLIWLPIAGVFLMLALAAFSALLFSSLSLERKSILTLILAGALSNLGFTGGAFVCYGLFGANGLSHANIYLIFWWPAVYLIFFPLLKIHELHRSSLGVKISPANFWDPRMIVIPASLAAIALNLAGIKPPAFIEKSHIIDIFVYTASALSFFAIGLLVRLSHLGTYKKLYFLLSAVKFILTPAVAMLFIWLLALTGRNLPLLPAKVILVQSATPCAILMVTISSVFDLDDRLAGALWVVNTAVFAVVVVPVFFFLLR